MVFLPWEISSGSTSARLACLSLFVFFFLGTDASPTSYASQELTHQNQGRTPSPVQIPNFIRCLGRAPLPSWRYWPDGVDPYQYTQLKHLCAPIEPPSLGFVCPIEAGSPIQMTEYASPVLRGIWPLIKICLERCWCPRPNDPDNGDSDVGFSGESEADEESDPESDPESESSNYSGPQEFGPDDWMMSDSESVCGGRQHRLNRLSTCRLPASIKPPSLPNKIYRPNSKPILKSDPKYDIDPISMAVAGKPLPLPPPPSRCGERCQSISQPCHAPISIEPLGSRTRSCRCVARRYQGIDSISPQQPTKWLATCLAHIPRVSGLGGRDVDVDSESGADAVACPCNSTYISQACCDTSDGLVWEGAERFMGRLDLDWLSDGELK